MMNRDALGTYLNDHLAGAQAGRDLADRIRERSEGSPLGTEMASILAEIEEDRKTLNRIVDELDLEQNPVKQTAGAVFERLSSMKLDPGEGNDQKLMMALETLELGIAGKVAMWRALRETGSRGLDLPDYGWNDLIRRGEGQIERVERERLNAAAAALID